MIENIYQKNNLLATDHEIFLSPLVNSVNMNKIPFLKLLSYQYKQLAILLSCCCSFNSHQWYRSQFRVYALEYTRSTHTCESQKFSPSTLFRQVSNVSFFSLSFLLSLLIHGTTPVFLRWFPEIKNSDIRFTKQVLLFIRAQQPPMYYF